MSNPMNNPNQQKSSRRRSQSLERKQNEVFQSNRSSNPSYFTHPNNSHLYYFPSAFGSQPIHSMNPMNYGIPPHPMNQISVHSNNQYYGTYQSHSFQPLRSSYIYHPITPYKSDYLHHPMDSRPHQPDRKSVV